MVGMRGLLSLTSGDVELMCVPGDEAWGGDPGEASGDLGGSGGGGTGAKFGKGGSSTGIGRVGVSSAATGPGADAATDVLGADSNCGALSCGESCNWCSPCAEPISRNSSDGARQRNRDIGLAADAVKGARNGAAS